jgi:hypothetical protein
MNVICDVKEMNLKNLNRESQMFFITFLFVEFNPVWIYKED